MNYLLIFEDGTIKKAETVDSEDLLSADLCLLELIDITNPAAPLRYFDDEWVQVDELQG